LSSDFQATVDTYLKHFSVVFGIAQSIDKI